MRLRPIPTRTKIQLRAQKKALAKPVPHSAANEDQYSRELESVAEDITQETSRTVTPVLKATLAGASVSILVEALDVVAAKLRQIRAVAFPMAKAMVLREDRHNERMTNQSLGIGFGDFSLRTLVMNEGIERVLAARVAENVGLIQSIPEKYMTDLSTAVFEAVSGGDTYENVTAEIERIGQMTHKRALRVARDQVAKANGALTQIRQTNLGVTEYVWQTAQDERVRPSHRIKHGQVFRWDTPPPDTGHPGQDYLCRCIAIGIIPL